ncbi:hypothetical protein BH708_06350 [Brachybacterium sp. P6-10-X1]|nr:hypothetical protein BH708_06350 [Brachybacterium sp. P6-10-X1]
MKALEKSPAITGWQAASTRDLDTIKGWVRRGFNLGIDTEKSGVIGIDEDAAGALDDWAALCPVDLPPTFVTRSGSGGRHALFRPPGRALFRSSNLRFRSAGMRIDVKARGGFLVAPGSVMPKGAYGIAEDAAIAELPAQVAEAWLRPVEAVAPAPVDGLGPKPTFIASEEPQEGPFPASAVEYLRAAAEGEFQGLRAAWEWSEGEHPNGYGWRQLTLNVANRLVLVANAAPDAFPLAVLRERFLAEAPTDPGWTPADNEARWADAVEDIGGWAKPIPASALDPAAVFSAVDGEQAPRGSETPAGIFELEVAREVQRLQVREEARRRFEAAHAPQPTEWDAGTLTDHLLKPPPPAARVEGLIPWEASTTIVAQRKTGKTTFELNLARSLITGEPFLGAFDVRPVDGRVAFLNFEVSGAQITGWAADLGIDPERFFLVNLRGVANPFATPSELDRLGALLRRHEVESIIVDPFGRAFTGESQNDAGQVQSWLLELDRFARAEAGARDVVLSVHAGWDGERTRGSSAVEDWGDSLIYLTKDPEAKDDPARFLRADGRDIDVAEDQLHFDRTTRLLTLTGRGSRRASRAARKINSLMPAVVEVIEAEPGIKTGEIESRLRTAGCAFQKGDGPQAAKAAEAANLVRSEPGKGTTVRWFPRPGSVHFPPDGEDETPGEGPRGGAPK